MEAITREEKLMSAASSGKSSGIKPITREEMFLSYIAGESKKKPKPITRKEMFLDKIESGGGSAPEVMENIVFPENTTGLPTAPMNIGGAEYTYYRVADFVPLEKMEKAKILYNFDGEIVGSSFEVGVVSPSGSYSDSAFRIVSVVEDNETVPFEMIETEVTFPKAGTYIIYSADMGGALITEIMFPDEIVALLEGTIEEITIPNDVTNLAKGVFGGCSMLKEINADESHEVYASEDGILYTKDGKKLVSYPPAKEETEYIMPDEVEEIENKAFNNATTLEKVVLSENIKAFPENLAIENKNAEIELVLNPEVLSQGDVYPIGSDLITTVTIPEGSTYLSATAFDNMPNIKNLYLNADCEVEMIGIDSKGDISYSNAISSMNNLKKLVIGGSAKNIPDNFLYNSSGGRLPRTLETLIIGDSVETIGDYACSYLNAVKELRIGNNVKSIGGQAFYCLNAVEGTLVIPDSVTELGYVERWGEKRYDTFSGMSNITNVIIGKGLTEIVSGMFSFCDKLTEVVIPSNIKTISKGAFSECTGLVEARIEEGVETIGECAFKNCYSLADVYIPRSVTSIHNIAFSGAGNWAENGRTTIHGYAGSYAETYATESGFNFEVIE